ncbi:OLC1v1023077C1 [Oldenlandia corymbosa var. corymbosa]|uniref:OLC1v1023077C1 n=1 Tax=Oldenlandia corymbosa var. corymbosa TaxID=529605 RepID=A0AAV1BZ58_OLDCO|nr:OLC1v1023077C1 [Oldenlandia corymbosa var. corymbosa]
MQMDIISSKPQEKENPSPTNSPHSNGSCSNGNGGSTSSPHQIPTPPATPKPVSRSEVNPYPTTFVQADTTTFKQVVQMLTGSSETAKQASPSSDPQQHSNNNNNKGCSIPPIKTGQKKQGFKLYERRNSLKNGLMISPLVPGFHHHQNSTSFSPRKPPEILSPSILDFPSLKLSPVTPLNEDTFSKSSSPLLGNSSEEEKAIAEKKFYLHPSPRTTTPRDSEPQLLPLFPVTSPRVSSGSSS